MKVKSREDLLKLKREVRWALEEQILLEMYRMADDMSGFAPDAVDAKDRVEFAEIMSDRCNFISTLVENLRSSYLKEVALEKTLKD